jgi:hypothetical protein
MEVASQLIRSYLISVQSCIAVAACGTHHALTIATLIAFYFLAISYREQPFISTRQSSGSVLYS